MNVFINVGDVALQKTRMHSKCRSVCHFGTSVCGAIAIFSPPSADYLTAVAALACQLIALAFKYSAQYYHELAREASRKALIIDGSGVSEDTLETSQLLKRCLDLEASACSQVRPSPDYFASKSPPGLLRLRDNLRESMFFPEDLFRRAAQQILWVLVIPTAAILLGLLTIPVVKAGAALGFGRFGIILLLFLSEIELVEQYLSWSRTAEKCRILDVRLKSTRDLSVPLIVCRLLCGHSPRTAGPTEHLRTAMEEVAGNLGQARDGMMSVTVAL
jgi:hypothetical protein